jgi:hypothetical protein
VLEGEEIGAERIIENKRVWRGRGKERGLRRYIMTGWSWRPHRNINERHLEKVGTENWERWFNMPVLIFRTETCWSPKLSVLNG